jgi:hypothetical protein
MEEQSREVRFHIFKFYLEKCHPPSPEELVTLTASSLDSVQDALKFLEEEHHLVLYKEAIGSPTPIAMVHSFSHLYVLSHHSDIRLLIKFSPTPYLVVSLNSST